MAGSETGTQAHETFAKERQFSTCRRHTLDCLVCVLRCSRCCSSGRHGARSSAVHGGNSTHLLGCHGLRFSTEDSARRLVCLYDSVGYVAVYNHWNAGLICAPCQDHDSSAVLDTPCHELLTSSREFAEVGLQGPYSRGACATHLGRHGWETRDVESPPLHILRCARASCQSVGRCATGVPDRPCADVARVISMNDSKIQSIGGSDCRTARGIHMDIIHGE